MNGASLTSSFQEGTIKEQYTKTIFCFSISSQDFSLGVLQKRASKLLSHSFRLQMYQSALDGVIATDSL